MKKRLLYVAALMAALCMTIAQPVQAQKIEMERVHENIRTVPYPQEGNALFINPAPLIVPKEMRKSELTQFQLSQDPTFPKGKTQQSKPLPWCMYNAHRTLESGTWYWRFRSITKDKKATQWSRTYSFTMTDDVPRFVTPRFEDFHKNMPKGYPRMYCFIDEGLERGKATAGTHPEYKEMKHRADGAMKNSHETNPNPYKVIGKIALDFNFLYTAYRTTGEQQYADKMLAVTRALLAVPHDESLRNDFVCGDMLYIFTHIYDACHDQLTEAERKELEKRTFAVAKHHHQIQRDGQAENHIFDNHYWQRAFREMLQLGLMFGDKRDDAKETLEYCYELWTARAPAGAINRDGEWHNGHGYFNANTKTLWYCPALLSHLSKSNFLDHPFYKNLGQALLYAWPPRTVSGGFGDGYENPDIPPRQRVALADYMARTTGDPYAAWYCNETKAARSDFDMRLLRFGMADKPVPEVTALPEGAPRALWMKDTGEMLAHSNLRQYRGSAFLSFRSSPFGSGSHTLSDQNSFNLSYKGKPVFRSSGYYLNFSDPHNLLSYRHTRAHNTILVNGMGQPFTTRAYGRITRMMTGATISYACGDASNAYCGYTDYPMWKTNFKNAKVEENAANGFGETPLTKYRRHILSVDKNIIVIYDELEASEPVDWDWLLHSPKQFTIKETERGAELANAVPEGKFTAQTYLYSTVPMTTSQTDQYFHDPDPKKMRKERKYPKTWHFDAKLAKSDKCRMLAVIILHNDEDKPRTVTTKDHYDYVIAGQWKMRAQLDAGKEPELLIRNPKTGVQFSLGSKTIEVDGQRYERTAGSSVLFDEMDGEWTIHEMTDELPLPTSTLKQE